MSREGWFFRPVQFLFLVNGIVTIFCGLTDSQVPSYHQDSWRSLETVFGNFPLIRIGVSSAYPSVQQSFSLSPSSHKTTPCSETLATDPSRDTLVSGCCYLPVSKHGADQLTPSSSPCHLAAYIEMCEVLSKAPWISKKAPSITTMFSTASSVCVFIEFRTVSVDFLVGSQIGNEL